MIEIKNILEVENNIDDVQVVIFDLDDTLYSELDYCKSGFDAINSKNTNKCIELLLNGFKPLNEIYKDNVDDVLTIYRNHMPNISLFPGVEEMLRRISINKKLGLITDGRIEGQNNKIKALGIENYFDKIIITDEYGIQFRKPNEFSYKTMKSFFEVNYKDMAYVGDNLNKDFTAPEKLGMKSIYFNNKNSLRNLINEQ